MQTEIIFSATKTIIENSISYEKAQMFLQLGIIKKEYEKARETARYLYGSKRGAWGAKTRADEKRSEKLDKLRDSIKYLEQRITQTN